MRFLRIGIILFFSLNLHAQQTGFELHKDKVEIPFKLVNNLILIPLTVNGTALTFLLDTGASGTVLYSKGKEDETLFSEKIVEFSGTGEVGNIESIKTTGNTVSIHPDFVDHNHTIHIISDENLDFLNHMDVPINGVIGYHFFKDYPVEINYIQKKLIVYKSDRTFNDRQHRYKKIPIALTVGQPYIDAIVQMTDVQKTLKLLLDLGNNDALWLFPLFIKGFTHNTPNINVVLGRGTHGVIKGKRSRIHAVYLHSFKISQPILATPDNESLQNLKTIPSRKGSIGNEILKRFHLIFDYPKSAIYLRKNRNFSHPFLVNKSGLKIKHAGFSWKSSLLTLLLNESSIDKKQEQTSFQFAYTLAPQYVVAHCRTGSPCDKSGLQKGDTIVRVNEKQTAKLSLSQIEAYLFKEEGTYINFEVRRPQGNITLGLRLKDPIPYQN